MRFAVLWMFVGVIGCSKGRDNSAAVPGGQVATARDARSLDAAARLQDAASATAPTTDARIVDAVVRESDAATAAATKNIDAGSELEQRCADGKGPAAACAAWVKRIDDGSDTDFVSSSVYERACQGGSVVACRKHGKSLLDELDQPISDEGHKILDQACRNGHDALACLYVARQMMAESNDLKGRLPTAVERYLEPGCALGNAKVCNELGFAYATYAQIKDLAKAATAYDGACKAGDTAACDKAEKLRATP